MGQVPLKSRIDSIIEQSIEKFDIPGLSVSILKDSELYYAKSFGYRSIENGEPVQLETAFHAASISKLFTAQAIIEFSLNGKLNLDEQLGDLVPELGGAFSNVTVRQILTHTSGIPDVYDYRWGDFSSDSLALLNYMKSIANKKLKSEPGSEFMYSNMSFEILGRIVEIVSGQSFGQYMKENVLDKVGMGNSNFRFYNIPSQARCTPYTKKNSSIIPRKKYPYNPAHAPSSTLNTTAVDLALWMKSFLQPDNQIRQIMSQASSNSFMGLGCFLGSIDENKTMYHYGGDRGFRSYLVMVPDKNIGLALLANCDYNEDFRQEILNSILKLLLEEK
jgi:CubicO group peptidase (beta-lactamase class C family)